MIQIAQKIVGYSVVKNEPLVEKAESDSPPIPQRPEQLSGTTYKIKTPLSEHALYVTVNDIEIDGRRRPFEVFINSKAMEHFQWIVALTRVISAVFRHDGDCTFLVEELKSVFDPKGGYFKKGGKYLPSLVAEIGEVIETHLTGLGLLRRDDSLAEAARTMLEEKLAKNDPADKMLVCPKCQQRTAIMMDGCLTCTAEGCYHSKCG